MSLYNLRAVLYKQFADISRNKMLIFMMLMYPLLLFLFYLLLKDNKKQVLDFIYPTFVTMHIIMSPIICFSSVLSEEKEKGTLRMLLLSGVNAMEYFSGVFLCLLLLLMLSTVPYYFILSLTVTSSMQLLLVSFIGITCSSLLGSTIGIIAKSQIAVGTISSPVSMIIGLLPMMSNFSSSLKKVSEYLYSQKIYDYVYGFGVSTVDIGLRDFIIFGVNFVIFALLFIVAYCKKDLVLGQ